MNWAGETCQFPRLEHALGEVPPSMLQRNCGDTKQCVRVGRTEGGSACKVTATLQGWRAGRWEPIREAESFRAKLELPIARCTLLPGTA